MTHRGLVVIQLLGALGILAYPAVLVASVAGIAAPGGGLRALPFRLLMLLGVVYPVLWGLLFVASWVALRRGHPGVAVALSMPPLLVTATGAVLLALSAARASAISRGYRAGEVREARRAGEENPLAGSLLLFSRGELAWPRLEEAIRAASDDELSRPVARKPVEVPGVTVRRSPGAPADPVRRSTPLAIALEGSLLARSLTTRDPDPLRDAAQALLARGARLSTEEEAGEPKLVWLAEALSRRTELPDRTAEAENPLVWTIVTSGATEQPRVASAIYAAARNAPDLLGRPTTTYGTPLRAALLRGMSDRARDLIQNGAVLSEAERRIPSVTGQLERFLDLPINGDCRRAYEESLRERPGTPAGAP